MKFLATALFACISLMQTAQPFSVPVGPSGSYAFLTDSQMCALFSAVDEKIKASRMTPGSQGYEEFKQVTDRFYAAVRAMTRPLSDFVQHDDQPATRCVPNPNYHEGLEIEGEFRLMVSGSDEAITEALDAVTLFLSLEKNMQEAQKTLARIEARLQGAAIATGLITLIGGVVALKKAGFLSR